VKELLIIKMSDGMNFYVENQLDYLADQINNSYKEKRPLIGIEIQTPLEKRFVYININKIIYIGYKGDGKSK